MTTNITSIAWSSRAWHTILKLPGPPETMEELAEVDASYIIKQQNCGPGTRWEIQSQLLKCGLEISGIYPYSPLDAQLAREAKKRGAVYVRKAERCMERRETRNYILNLVADNGSVYALCSDGRIYETHQLDNKDGSHWLDWKLLPPIPGEVKP